MSKADSSHLSADHEPQLLTEFLIGHSQGLETRIVEHVSNVLSQFDFDPGQLKQILTAIDQSLQRLANENTSLHVRISVAGIDPARDVTEDGAFKPNDLKEADGGVGFFLIRRIVDRIQATDPEGHRLLEILIYRESGEAKS